MARLASSSPELSSAMDAPEFQTSTSPIICLNMDAGVSFSTLQINLKDWKWEMGAWVDSQLFIHQNLKLLANHQKAVCPHQPNDRGYAEPAWPLVRGRPCSQSR